MLMHSTEVGDHCMRTVPLIGSCCTSIILKGPWVHCVGLATLPKYGLPMSRGMRTLSSRWNSCRMHLRFLASLADYDWACLQLLMAYQLVVKEVGRIMSWLNASWAGLAFKVLWNIVLMAHITGMRSSCWADTVSRSWVTRQLKCRRFPITWWVRSRILLAWGFLTVVNLDQIPYDWRSSWNLVETNSVSLSCKQSTGWGVATEPNLVKGVSNADAFLVFQCHNFHEMCV
jgi:hypothetical protein